MRLGSFGYLARQGWKSMAANRMMTFASVGVLTACLIITGIASLLSININRIVEYFGNQNEVILYVAEGTSEERIAEMGGQIWAMPNILEVQYVSKEGAFAEMQAMMKDKAHLLAGFEQLFPASYRVTVDDLNFMDQTGASLSALPDVESVDIPSELAGVMVTLKNAVTYGGWALVAVLGLVSIIVISNTIRLTVFARRREISIMKYVGATNAFIRLPFFVEGMTVGAIAGLLAAGLVCGAYYLVYEYLTNMVNLWISAVVNNLLPLQEIWQYVLGGFVAFGILIGGMGTAFSVRKHLKV